MKKMIPLAFLLLAACGHKGLEDPRFVLPTPPAELMEEPGQLKTID